MLTYKNISEYFEFIYNEVVESPKSIKRSFKK